MATKKPSVQEFLTDPKYAEDKIFFRDLVIAIASEENEKTEKTKKAKKGEDDGENFFDLIFGGKTEE